MAKLQTQGVHHITLVGADRQTSDRFLGGRARHAARVRAAQSRRSRDEPSLFRSGRWPADHHFHQREFETRLAAQPDGHRQPASSRLHRLARHLHAGQDAAGRARLFQLRRSRPRLHVLDLFPRSAGPAAGAGLLQVRAASRRHACRRAARGAQHPRGQAPTTSPTSIWPTPSSCCRRSLRRPSATRLKYSSPGSRLAPHACRTATAYAAPRFDGLTAGLAAASWMPWLK